MMKQLVEYDTADGKKVYVEAGVPEQAPVEEPKTLGALPPLGFPTVQGQGKFEDKLQEALDAAEPAFTAIRDKFRSIEPKTIDLEFGLDMKMSVGPVWVFTAGVDATISIKLHWET